MKGTKTLDQKNWGKNVVTRKKLLRNIRSGGNLVRKYFILKENE